MLYKTNDEARLALRTLYATGGLDKIGEIMKECDKLDSTNVTDSLHGLDGPMDYSQVYRMAAQPDVEFGQEVVLKDTITACWLVKLAIMSGFVQVNDMSAMLRSFWSCLSK